MSFLTQNWSFYFEILLLRCRRTQTLTHTHASTTVSFLPDPPTIKTNFTTTRKKVVAPMKAKSRLRFRLNSSKFATNAEKSATSTLGLVDGNSTITVNTMGDTTDDSSGEHRKGIDLAPANTISAFNQYSSSWREVSACGFGVDLFIFQFLLN